MADEKHESREPDKVEQASSAQAGESKSQVGAPAATMEFIPPNYAEMNARISETRKQAGPPLQENDPASSEVENIVEEEETGPTDPS